MQKPERGTIVLPDGAPIPDDDCPASPAAMLARALGPCGRADVRRAIAEFVAGRPVTVVRPGRAPRLVVPVEPLEPSLLAALQALATGGAALVVSRTRAAVLGGDGCTAATLHLTATATVARVHELVAAARVADVPPLSPGDRTDEAAIELAKLARLLPAAISVPIGDADGVDGVLAVDAEDVLAFRAGQANALRLVSSAPVPLRTASDSEMMVFRDELGEPWSLIRVGRPDTRGVVPVRLHSACLTGDAFESLRCDCGDQLRMALAAIHALGGGVLLYLAQEGCGIGLANKMRAYRLQEQGLDTVDANTALGFEADERRYDTGARMLRAVGIERVALLTNNPTKLDALRAAGIDVRERIPLLAPVGGGNHRYLATKRRRAGHLIGDAPLSGAG